MIVTLNVISSISLGKCETCYYILTSNVKTPITRIASLLLPLLVGFVSQAQAPQLINYQAVARHANTGAELANREVYLQVQVRAGGPSGNIVYQESHENIITDAFGLFSIHIGGGNMLAGNFSQISWGYNSHWLDISMDIGAGLLPFGAMQFVSVPYALHAGTVANVDDADADPSNELISNVVFNNEASTLTIEEAGVNFDVDLSALANTPDADADPTNELINTVNFNTGTSTLTIEEAGVNFDVDLSALANTPDADADPTNELIPIGGLSLSGTMLQIVEGAVTHQVDLQPIISAIILPNQTTTGWDVTTAPNRVFNNTARVGIGHTAPSGQLEVRGTGALGEAVFLATRTDATTIFGINSDGVRIPLSSSISIQGQVRYAPKILSGSGNYTVEPTDHILVWKVNYSGPRSIFLPLATDFPGRVIKVVKAVTGANSQISISSFSQINFGFGPLTMTANDVSSITFLSIGADGWITMDGWED